MSLQKRNTPTDLENALMAPRGRVVRQSGMDMYTPLCLKWITSKDLLSSTGNSAQRCVAAWMGGGHVVEWIHVCAWPSPFAAHLKLSQHY